MRIAIINKSDSTGGAAVVSRRLMEALREEGIDARMLVTEKLTDSPYVEKWPSEIEIKRNFIAERLKIFLANGFNRDTLFKIDTASDGLPLWKHPLVKSADAILLNWVNQGMLSLKGVRKLLQTGKPVIWTMHDMWSFTGICHHAGHCRHFLESCGDCPLLGERKNPDDLSHKILCKKNSLYASFAHEGKGRMAFVAVSRWLLKLSRESRLLSNCRVELIHNAFNIGEHTSSDNREKEKIRILFGAARLDDPIKGLDILSLATKILKEKYPEEAQKLEIFTFGGIKDARKLDNFEISHRHLGMIRGDRELKEIYGKGDILVSASSYETLPGTLVEAQAYGCIPVSFNRGGQADIIDHEATGFLAEYSEDPTKAASNLAEVIVNALKIAEDSERRAEMAKRMRESVEARFSYRAIARKYIGLIEDLRTGE